VTLDAALNGVRQQFIGAEHRCRKGWLRLTASWQHLPVGLAPGARTSPSAGVTLVASIWPNVDEEG